MRAFEIAIAITGPGALPAEALLSDDGIESLFELVRIVNREADKKYTVEYVSFRTVELDE